MTSVSLEFEVGAVALGYVGLVASWRRQALISQTRTWEPQLVIQQCADTDEGAHTPASSVTIASRQGLMALRDAIEEALKKPGAPA
jgi:hypothetical protein